MEDLKETKAFKDFLETTSTYLLTSTSSDVHARLWRKQGESDIDLDDLDSFAQAFGATHEIAFSSPFAKKKAEKKLREEEKKE